jgi:glucose/arabinose dehydrogenase
MARSRSASALTVVTLLIGTAATVCAGLPAGFQDTLIASVAAPTALAFAPDGRLLITTQAGQLRVVQNETLLATSALNLSASICTNSERGLLGVAVDPAFASNRFVYLFYTFKKFGVCEQNTARSPVNRVARFVLPASNVIDRTTEVVLVDNIPSPNGNHNAGDLHFGKDGFLYVTTGDGGCDYAGDSGCGGGERRIARPQRPRRQAAAHYPRRRDSGGQSVSRCRNGAMQRQRTNDRRVAMPGNLRVGFSQPVPLCRGSQRVRHAHFRQ